MKTTLRFLLALCIVLLLCFFHEANATVRTFQFSGTTSSFDGSTSGAAMTATVVYDDAAGAVSSGTGYAYYNYTSFTIVVGATTYTAGSGTIGIEIPPSAAGSEFVVSDNTGEYRLSLANGSTQVFSTTALPTSLTLSLSQHYA